ncbi:MAG TPA: M48 family metalloprotease [Tepidisphaeraceae bacterium]|jgi:predicted Zn-dependent protease|nr:M48 family metalloprotease [Tepidisphaeraceae bacterium]
MNLRFLRRSSLLVALFVSFALMTGCATDRSVLAQADQLHGSLEPAVIEDPQLASYLQKIGDRIISAAQELDKQHFGPKSHFDKSQSDQWMFSNKMKFHFVNSKQVNAFTTGGEHMYVYNALFQMVKNEDELAAVMAHEYGHVYARHVAKGTNRQLGMLIGGAIVGGAAGYALGGDNKASAAAVGAGAGTAGAGFLNMGFTRKDEEEADWLGFNFYTRAGWDPNRFGDFFQTMIDKGYDKTPELLSDHPSLANRVKSIREWVKKLPANAKQWQQPNIADDAQFKDLQARAAKLAKTLPDDSKIKSSQQLAAALPHSCVMPYEPKETEEARQQLAKQAQTKKKSQ